MHHLAFFNKLLTMFQRNSHCNMEEKGELVKFTSWRNPCSSATPTATNDSRVVFAALQPHSLLHTRPAQLCRGRSRPRCARAEPPDLLVLNQKTQTVIISTLEKITGADDRQPLETRLLSTFPNNPDLEIQDNSTNH